MDTRLAPDFLVSPGGEVRPAPPKATGLTPESAAFFVLTGYDRHYDRVHFRLLAYWRLRLPITQGLLRHERVLGAPYLED